MNQEWQEETHPADFLPGLYLFPLPLSGTGLEQDWIGPRMKELLHSTRLIFAENERTARRFVSSLKLGIRLEQYQLERLDKNSGSEEINAGIRLLKKEGRALLMSEAGCPGVADPGAELTEACHRNGIAVHPLTGPSSILMALMASGLSGQAFSFHGYLPIDRRECAARIRALELESAREKRTQIVIETPYRNGSLWQCLLDHLSPSTRLCYARDLTGPSEEIRQQAVGQWKKESLPEWQKTPTVFLFMAG